MTGRNKNADDAKVIESLKLELESRQRELDDSRKRLNELERGELLLAGENRLLQMVASGSPLMETLTALCRLIEELSSRSLCGILLVDSTGTRVEYGAGPSLPTSYNEAIHGLTVTPSLGPCGLAVCRKEQVIVSDLATDARWDQEWRTLALSHGLRACWSTPILSSVECVLGTFAIYWREPRSPAEQDQKTIAQVTHLAAVAIERKRTEQELRRSEAFLAEAQTEQKRAEILVAGEKKLLEMIARGNSLLAVLEALCRFGEEMSGNVLVSLLLVSPDGKSLRHGAAPSLPKSYTEAIDGGLIGPRSGSCGTAAYRRERVIVSDIMTDSLWDQYRHLAMDHGLRACWSTPIFSATRDVMGTFALYSREPGSPNAEQLNLIERITHLAAVAIERKKSAEALHASEHLARGQLDALARTLDAMAQESEPDKLLEHALRTIVEQSAAHSVSVWVRTDDGNRLERIAVIEDSRFVNIKDASYSGPTFPSVAPHHPVWRDVFRTRQHALLEDLERESVRMCVGSGPDEIWHRVLEDTDPDPEIAALKKYLRGLGVRTILFVPMLIAGEVAGIVGIRLTQRRSFHREEIELTRALAHQAMLAIQLMRLSEQSRQAAVAAERNRMARDIHDTLAQGFTGVIMQLEAVKGAIAQNELAEAIDRVERAGDLARVGLGEARRSVLALRPRSLQNASLCMALDDLLNRMTNGSGLQAEFQSEGDEPAIPAEWEEGLLRVAQESLTNTIKHAKATNFRATLTIGAKEIQFRLVDDGSGFDLHAEHEGFGLLGMKERVDQMGGQFILRSMPGQGTEIQIILNNSAKQKPNNGGEHA